MLLTVREPTPSDEGSRLAAKKAVARPPKSSRQLVSSRKCDCRYGNQQASLKGSRQRDEFAEI